MIDNAVRVVVYGRVQGVWYRGWTVQQANDLGLAGWVRNRRDGTVEAFFAGEEDTIEEMLRRCGDGPPAARVDKVDRYPAAANRLKDFGNQLFQQRPTV